MPEKRYSYGDTRRRTRRAGGERRGLRVGPPVVLVAIVAVWLSSVGGASGAPIRLADCGMSSYGGTVKPTEWSAGCVGASFRVTDLTWTTWGGTTATGTGWQQFNTCEPDCAGGELRRYPVTVTVSHPKVCASPHGYVRYYTRLVSTTAVPVGDPWADSVGGRFGPFSIGCTKPSFLVKTTGRAASFGAFTESRTGTWSQAGDLEAVFGPGTWVRQNRYVCEKRWPALGIRASFGRYGDAAGASCDRAYFQGARLTGRMWRTPTNVRPGGKASRARAARRRVCRVNTCSVNGYALQVISTDCARSLPSIIAATSGGRVRSLLVRSHNCE